MLRKASAPAILNMLCCILDASDMDNNAVNGVGCRDLCLQCCLGLLRLSFELPGGGLASYSVGSLLLKNQILSDLFCWLNLSYGPLRSLTLFFGVACDCVLTSLVVWLDILCGRYSLASGACALASSSCASGGRLLGELDLLHHD